MERYIMEERIQRAYQNHKKGYNCAQSVLCAYSDLLGVEEEVLFRISEGFGLGMGRMDTCGAVTGMLMAVGLLKSAGDLENCKSKPETMKAVKELQDAFLQKNGSIMCREIKGVDTKKVLRSCDGCIEDAVRLLGETFFADQLTLKEA